MDTRNFAYMFYGFLAAWLIIVVYVATLVARNKKLKTDIDQLKHMLEDRGGK